MENNAPVIYPNTDSDYFEISSTEQLRNETYNAVGQKIKTTSAKKIDIRNFPIGTYHVEIHWKKSSIFEPSKVVDSSIKNNIHIQSIVYLCNSSL